jgi:hypothetical protein
MENDEWQVIDRAIHSRPRDQHRLLPDDAFAVIQAEGVGDDGAGAAQFNPSKVQEPGDQQKRPGGGCQAQKPRPRSLGGGIVLAVFGCCFGPYRALPSDRGRAHASTDQHLLAHQLDR